MSTGGKYGTFGFYSWLCLSRAVGRQQDITLAMRTFLPWVTLPKFKALLINSSAISLFPLLFLGSCKLFSTTQFHTCMSEKHLDRKLVTSR